MHLREERPIAITIIDSADRIHAFISEINELITRGLIVTDPVDVVLYTDQPDGELTAPMTLHGRPVMAPVSVRTRGANRRRLAAHPARSRRTAGCVQPLAGANKTACRSRWTARRCRAIRGTGSGTGLDCVACPVNTGTDNSFVLLGAQPWLP
jgi:Uncharacterized ACR, COG1993